MPRVHVLVRPETKLSVIIRTGSHKGHKVSCTIGWDRRTDAFTMGQWLGGRIYPHESDISPDGEWLYYNALNAKWNDAATLGCYGALSRAPYLKAVHLFPVGNRWMVGSQIWTIRRGKRPHPTPCPPMPSRFGLSSGLYRDRLQRDGWRFHEEVRVDDRHTYQRYDRAVTRTARIEKRYHFGGDATRPMHYETHILIDAGGTRHPKDDWEWAEVDGPALLWAAGGVVYRGRIDRLGLPEDEKPVYDLNGMRFQRLVAPY